MLTHLHILDFTLVDTLDLELANGLTAITGETGAGKSILLDALGLALGDRADASKVRSGAQRAEVSASFDIRHLPEVARWLQKHDLDDEECLLKRVVTSEGRSRAYINGQTATLQQLRALGERLIDFHSQHAHHSLLNSSTQRDLIDAFGHAEDEAREVRLAADQWQSVASELENIRQRSDEMTARVQLLRYQVDELDQLDLGQGEVEALEREHRLLANAEQTQSQCRALSDVCGGDNVGLIDRLRQALRLVEALPECPKALENVAETLNSALIHVGEAQSDLERFLDSDELDPERLHEVETRLNTLYEVARKHRVGPDELVSLHENLRKELAGLHDGDEAIAQLEAALDTAQNDYQSAAASLSDKRIKAAKRLTSGVNKKLKQLAMAHARFEVALNPQETSISRHGDESVALLIATQPNQPAQALGKIASGGELSRVGLAIQVVTAQSTPVPSLVFDEVDVGIGGTTGDVVGEMLRTLGESTQVFCVTHLAQVASKAHHHLRIEKRVTRSSASSQLEVLDQDERVLEVARMMGGDVASETALDHARQMLAEV